MTMTFLKNLGLVLLIATATVTFSTTALAEAKESRIAWSTVDAIDLIISKIKVAITAIDADSTCEQVTILIREALNASKEINASDLVDKDRMKANQVLKTAKNHAKECNLIDAKKELTQAENMFLAMKIRDLKLQNAQ